MRKNHSSFFVFSNLAISLDGKIAFEDRKYFPLGTQKDRKHMQVLRNQAEVIVFGAETLRIFRRPCLVRGKKIINLVVSQNLKRISLDWPFFQSGSIQRVFVVTKQLSQQRKKRFQKYGKVFEVKKRFLGKTILKICKNMGWKNILIEGGGSLMWEFVRDDLIDQYHVTWTPKILGGKRAPSLVDGNGFSFGTYLNLKIKSIRQVGNEVYLVYQSLGIKKQKRA